MLSLFRSNWRRMLIHLLVLTAVCAVVTGIAQTGNEQQHGIIIDGTKNPERIPDWIVWSEVFRTAISLYDTSSGKGQELWVDQLGLPKNAMNEIVKHGYEHRDLKLALETEAKKIVADNKGRERKEVIRGKLRHPQANLESRTLQLRDKLRTRIGEDAYLRLLSYARLNIATKIVVGN